MALLPLQNVEETAVELRRAVEELGMLGGMLPSNGEAIQGHLGKKNLLATLPRGREARLRPFGPRRLPSSYGPGFF